MSTLRKSFIAGILMFAALIMVIPVAGSAELIKSKPKVTDEDVALTVRVSPGYRFRGGYRYGPYRYYNTPYPQYYHPGPYRGYYYQPYNYQYNWHWRRW